MNRFSSMKNGTCREFCTGGALFEEFLDEFNRKNVLAKKTRSLKRVICNSKQFWTRFEKF